MVVLCFFVLLSFPSSKWDETSAKLSLSEKSFDRSFVLLYFIYDNSLFTTKILEIIFYATVRWLTIPPIIPLVAIKTKLMKISREQIQPFHTNCAFVSGFVTEMMNVMMSCLLKYFSQDIPHIYYYCQPLVVVEILKRMERVYRWTYVMTKPS